MNQTIFLWFVVVSFLAAILLAGCTSPEPGHNLSDTHAMISTHPSQNVSQATRNVSLHILTPAMRSQAIAIALNSSEMKTSQAEGTGFEVTSVVLPEQPYQMFIGRTLYQRYFPVVSITTATKNLTMYIDLEKGEVHAVDRVYTYSEFSNDPEVLAILASAPANDHLTDEQISNETFEASYQPTCQKLYEAMRKKNATYDQISALLEMNGYYWIPGDLNQSCGTGYWPSAQDREILNAVRGPGYNPYGRPNK